MTVLIDIRLPGPTVIDPPSFEEYDVSGATITLATEAGDTITTEAGDPLGGPAIDTLVTSNGLLFFGRVEA